MQHDATSTQKVFASLGKSASAACDHGTDAASSPAAGAIWALCAPRLVEDGGRWWKCADCIRKREKERFENSL